jgi:hypothetical protein
MEAFGGFAGLVPGKENLTSGIGMADSLTLDGRPSLPAFLYIS